MEQKEIKCLKCDYKWEPRKNPEDIISCPRCKQHNWNKDHNKGVCQNCGRNFLLIHEHHILPRKKGGTDNKTNLMYVCASCHKYLHKQLNKRLDK